ncbi:LpxI family protein [Phycisphaera mikurensis]|uniref:DUF1009 domain-containing protein n=1 Tax=Phycisphaera mikurensis (strain NBRC 102666 / KCTC 22515 / FYK2301M01) TaxID=1142394 RepID=I0IG32_PHYMF|nr:UDP-2,3-diacylglucosamine diphosphatase LpxI [Phycisphaera mikurensis]MBB6440396.1 hypothetical protein [Phycisphaera mikurensis]BAM04220.1 hypothetical protein PSMK_20610 [Phycisphaera mikurensis NBRC 102666]
MIEAAALAPIGLIAGEGRLPVLVAEGLVAAGRRVVAVSLSGCADGSLAKICEEVVPVSMLRPGGWARALRRRGAAEAIMVGRVGKGVQYDVRGILGHLPDWRAARVWLLRTRHDRRSQALLGHLADELAAAGITLIDSTTPVADHLARAGWMTRSRPAAGVLRDAELAWSVLERMNELEVGQAIAVRGRDVLAVEAAEGTDAMIRRAGELARGKGWTLCKGAGPAKDPRFDVPTVGLETIANLRAAGAVCLVLDAGGVILVDRKAVLAAADEAGIAVCGLGPGVGVLRALPEAT